MTQSFGDCVRLNYSGPIATVTLDRGDGRNALSLRAMQALT
jgi:enoyl-CoA hydratase/carnithine racemase